MTILELRDNFIAELDFEHRKRGIDSKIVPNDKMIASWISEAQQEVHDTVSPVKKYYDFTVTSGYTTYTMPTDFGSAIRAEYNGNDVPIVSQNDFVTTGTLAISEPSLIAIYHNGTAWTMMINQVPSGVSYTVRVWYSPNTLFYAPSGSSAQDWGTFDGLTFSGNVKVPDKYYRLLVDYLLGKFFTEFEQKFRVRLAEQKSNFSNSVTDNLPYNFAGVKN